MVIAPTPKHDQLMAISSSQLGGGDFAKLASLPGFFKWVGRNCIFRTTGANLGYVLRNWPDAEWIGGTDEVRQAYLSEQSAAASTVAQKSSARDLSDDSGYHYKREPMAHQRRAFILSRDRPVFALFQEQGTGKTKVTLDTASYLFQKGAIDCLVVVAWPNGVHRNWVEYEVPLDVGVPHLTGYWTSRWQTKRETQKRADFINAKRGKKLKIFCFNVEAFTSPGARAFILSLLSSHKVLLVIDQSASIKNPQAKRTKFLIDKCSRLAAYRRVLDGQPVAEGASELYSQFKFLDPWIIGHDTWTGFKAEFCKIGYWNEIVGYRNLPELRRRIDGYVFRVRADECLDLPPRIYKVWPFSLGGEEQRIFDELKVQDIATFSEPIKDIEEEDRSLEEHNALVKNMRLQQISSGWWPKDKMRQIEKELPSRAAALLNLIEAIGKEKALIFARFRADLDLLQRLLGPNAVSYHGGISDDNRAIAKRRFMEDNRTQFFLGQPRSAGFGHTLTAARHVIFYSNDHSLRLREECEKRAHRQGLMHHLHIWDLIAEGTQDLKIVRAFRAKKELANEILLDPDNFFLAYE